MTQRKVTVEALIKDHARAIVQALYDAELIDEECFGLTKEASERFLRGTSKALLAVDTTTLIRLLSSGEAKSGPKQGVVTTNRKSSKRPKRNQQPQRREQQAPPEPAYSDADVDSWLHDSSWPKLF